MDEFSEDEFCSHENIFTTEGGEGYCCDCGLSLDAVRSSESNTSCEHKTMYKSESGLFICRDCNKEIEVFSHEAEWRYYDHHVGSTSDPSRCHTVHSATKSLKKTFENLNMVIPEAIQHQVEKDFSIIVGEKTLRSRNRNSIIAACLFYAYIKFNEHRTSDYIRSLFSGLSRRDMSHGIKQYQKVFPETQKLSFKPHHLVPWIFSLTGIDRAHYENVIAILDYINKTSMVLNRSTIQSVANAAIYFYLCLMPEYKEKLGLTKSVYAEKVRLSEITITKLVKEISKITNHSIKV